MGFDLIVRTFALQTIAEDPDGAVCTLSLYNYPGSSGTKAASFTPLLPPGTILAIREPFLKAAADESINLRVDCPSDLIFLEPNDPLLQQITWKSKLQPTPDPRTEEDWKVLGNKYFKVNNFLAASTIYSRGLLHNPTSNLLRLNRAMSFLRMRYYAAALADCEALTGNPSVVGNVRCKALHRAAQGLYGLGKWEDATTAFKSVAGEFPEEADGCLQWIRKCSERKAEATSGAYKWVEIFTASQAVGVRPDVAEFMGPIRVSSVKGVGGGRGIVAKKAVTAGELLVCP